MRYLTLLVALLFVAPPAWGACPSTRWPACTVLFSSGENLEDSWSDILVGNCTVPPCLTGSEFGGTSFTLYEGPGESANFDLHPSIGVDASIKFGRATGTPSATTWHVGFLNRSVLQNWQGEQKFSHADGIRAAIYKGLESSSIFLGGAGENEAPWVFVDTEFGMKVTSDVGTMVFDGVSFDVEKIPAAPDPEFNHGAYYVGNVNPLPSIPKFISGDDSVVHTLADLDDNEFTGDQTYSGAGSGIPYGACQGSEIGWTQASAVQDQWYDISDADMVTTQLNEITHDGLGQLMVLKAGMYAADWSGAFSANATGVHAQITFSVNGTEGDPGINHFQTVAVSRELPVAGTTILDLAADDTVNVSIRTTDGTTPTLGVDHLLIRLGLWGGN